MDKNWSEMNREMQVLFAKKDTFTEGLEKLFTLRKSLFEQITQIVETFPGEAFYQKKTPFERLFPFPAASWRFPL